MNTSNKSLSTGKIVGGIVILLVLICGMNACSSYNSLVNLDEDVNNAWANVENQYQRRLDLIPNLVETVKGYAEHESNTFTTVTEARAGLTQAFNKAQESKPADASEVPAEQDFAKYTSAQADLTKAFSIYVNAVKEAYPDLKANQNFTDLMTQLEGTENRISTERKRYNEVSTEYNKNVRRFPKSVWAGMFGFDKRPQFAAEEGANKAPKVSF